MPGPLTHASKAQRKAYRRGGLTAVRKQTKIVGNTNEKVQHVAATTGATPILHTTPRASRQELHQQRAVARALKRAQRATRRPRLTAPYDPNEAAALVKRVGGSNAEARALSTKVIGESGGNPKAVGHDPGGSTGLGLFQVTKGVGNDALINHFGGEAAMLKAGPNARAALQILRSQGIGAWYAPSNAPGNPKGAGQKISRKDKKTLKKAGVPVPRPTKGRTAPGKHKPAIAELFYDPGTSIKEGSQISPIGGHGDHVHIAADDPKSEKRFIKIAQSMGLHVGENVFVGDTPEAGVHVGNSYHYRTMTLPSGKKISGAADVTGTPAQMMAFDQRIAQKFGHNVPHGGSYALLTGSGSPAYGGYSGPASFSKATGVPIAQAKRMTPQERMQVARKHLNKIQQIFSDSPVGEATKTADSLISRLEKKYSD